MRTNGSHLNAMSCHMSAACQFTPRTNVIKSRHAAAAIMKIASPSSCTAARCFRPALTIGVFLIAATAIVSAHVAENGLTGDHVCQVEQKYRVNVTAFVPKNITVRSFQWCMQVPPRCSTFTYRIVNESRTVEEERTRLVNVCCNGYEPSASGEICQPSCSTKCLNGVCNEENKCYCSPGYRGDFCEKACDATRWGRYCRYHCDCHRGLCDPALGHCLCPPGWLGLRCEKQCPHGLFGVQCRGICDCAKEQLCEPQTGNCTFRGKVAVLKKYHTFDSAPQPKPTVNYKKIDMYLLTTEASQFLNETLITDRAHGNRDNGVSTPSTSSEKSLSTPLENARAQPDRNATRNAEVNIKSVDHTAVMKSATPSPVEHQHRTGGKVHAEVAANETHDGVANADGNRSAHISHSKTAEIDVERISNYKFATVGFLAVACVVISAFCVVMLRKQQRPTKEPTSTQMHRANHAVSKSIFHTPLPEPPQSPFFESPICAHYHTKIGENEVTFHSRTMTKIEEEQEQIDGFYDQLPSTGTYKAAMVPEPPTNANIYVPENTKRVEIVNSSEANAGQDDENVYDEIPCWTRSTQNDALYINMRIENKTKF